VRRLVGTALGTSTLETAITVVHNGRKLSVTTPMTTDRVDILDAVLHEEGASFSAYQLLAMLRSPQRCNFSASSSVWSNITESAVCVL
jgi:hypothetical protein